MKRSKVLKNTVMLYIMTFAKMIFPLVTLPYLTRVLTVDGYAVVSYVKSAMVYMQIFMDFGFLLSATKDIVLAGGNKEAVSEILGETLQAKILLAICGFVIVLVACLAIPLLRENMLYTFFAYIAVAMTILLPDFLFRGIEKMQNITIRFIIMRGIATALTFVCIKDDHQLMLIPVLDIIGTIAAVVWTWFEVKKLGFKIIWSKWSRAWAALKKSFIYFLSDASTTVFGAFNTLLVGIYLTKTDVAYWSVVMQLIAAVQSLYTPINNGIYPHMVRERNIKLPLKLFACMMPIIIGGTVIAFVTGEWWLVVISGEKYSGALTVFRWMLPLLIISYPSMLFGWPCLGAINKQKQVTISTVASALVQVIILLLLIFVDKFTLVGIAMARIVSEFVLLTIRLIYCYMYRKEFFTDN